MHLLLGDEHPLVHLKQGTLLLRELFADHNVLIDQCAVDLVRIRVQKSVVIKARRCHILCVLKQFVRRGCNQRTTDPTCRFGDIELKVKLLSHPLDLESMELT